MDGVTYRMSPAMVAREVLRLIEDDPRFRGATGRAIVRRFSPEMLHMSIDDFSRHVLEPAIRRFSLNGPFKRKRQEALSIVAVGTDPGVRVEVGRDFLYIVAMSSAQVEEVRASMRAAKKRTPASVRRKEARDAKFSARKD